MRPIILYTEVPCFYAAVERRDTEELRTRPLIVGGDPRKRGQVAGASEDALAAGVVVGMPMLAALERCPSARSVRTNMKRYREVSGLLQACQRKVVDSLEPTSLEAAFLDVRLVRAGDEAPEEVALRLQNAVLLELGLRLRVGIARAKFLARLAAEEAGERGVRRVVSGQERAFLDPLPVERLPGVGRKTLATLRELGASTVAHLRLLDPADLEERLGNHGLRILEFARGEDDSPVRAARHPQTLSRESTFPDEQLDLAVIGERLQRLSAGLEERLHRQGLSARRVALKVRYADEDTVTRSCTLRRPVSASGDLYRVAVGLLDRTHAGSRPLRKLGLSVSGLGTGLNVDRQLQLFSDPD